MPRNFNIKGMFPATPAAWKEPQVLVRIGLGVLLAELNRVLNHLMFLGSYPLEIGAITPPGLRNA